jgi:single-strand DNA-binding protein
MADLNKVFLIGRLTKDPELRYTPGGAPVTDLRVATSRNYTGKDGERREESLFIDVTVWNRQAENCCQYLAKGRQVHVEGHLKMDSWDDRETGAKRSQIKVVADHIQFLDSRRNDDSGSSYHSDDDSAPAPPRRSAPANGAPRGSYPPSGDYEAPAPRRPSAPPPPVEDVEDDIPF